MLPGPDRTVAGAPRPASALDLGFSLSSDLQQFCDQFPDPGKGIHYDDLDFNGDFAAQGYGVNLVATDGYTQTVTSDLIAGDDRFIVAFKKDNVFLDPESNGYMRFVYDDAVELPEGMRLKSVKFLAEIFLDL